MVSNFFKLPRELRDKVYKLCLLDQNPISPWYDFYSRQVLTPGLLRANKTIHSEASSLFYAQNCFDFRLATAKAVAVFLETIGRNNADRIRNVHVDFQNFPNLKLSNVTLEEASDGMLAKIQSDYANLRTLTTFLASTNAIKVMITVPSSPKTFTQAFRLVPTRFKAISSLLDIIVEVDEDDLDEHMRRQIENHGWTVVAIKHAEGWGSDRF